MTDFKKLKVGEVLSETQFYKVQKIAGDKVQLQNDFGEPIVVNKDYVDGLSRAQEVKRADLEDVI